eukprot:scaffold7692_cov163-Amphora_coffeaeformis.AAC.5
MRRTKLDAPSPKDRCCRTTFKCLLPVLRQKDPVLKAWTAHHHWAFLVLTVLELSESRPTWRWPGAKKKWRGATPVSTNMLTGQRRVDRWTVRYFPIFLITVVK